jgi:hypothetical protein
MANLLATLGGAATTFNAAERGRDIERARRRKLQIEGREDERYGYEKGKRERESERGEIEHGEFKRTTEEETGAREAALAAGGGDETATPGGAAPLTTLPATGETGQTMPARTLGAAAKETAPPTAPTVPGGQPAPEGPAKALWLQQAEAQRDYWTKRGRPDRASKVIQDAINGRIAEMEAVNKFETLPQIEAIRRKGLPAQELEADQKFRELKRKADEGDVAAGGLMWGHMLAGNKKAAIDSFNSSGLTLPGVQVADIGQSADGTKIYLLDKDGRIAKDKNGKDLVYPRQLLDNLWRQASSSTLKLGKGESIYQTRRDATGGLTAEPVITAPDPAEKRAAAAATSSDDARWATVLNQARSAGHRYLKDTLGLTPNALGQVMKPDNMPLFEKAQPIMEKALQDFRASGKRMDQVTATDLAKKALAQAREELAREKAGAGAENPNPNAPAGGGPSWRDMLQ